MASMSYCCIENTRDDMCQVVEKFKKRQNDVQGNPYEKDCIEDLYDLCKEYVEAYEEYMEDPDAYIKSHSEEEEDDE